MSNSMNILFIGVAASSKVLAESDLKYNKNKESVRPQQHFDFKLIKGLSKIANIKAISEPPVASYPKSKCIFYKNHVEIDSAKLSIDYIGIINILAIKTFMISFFVFFKSFKYIRRIKKKQEKIVILLGYLSIYTFVPIYVLSKIYKVKIVAMVPDIPIYLSNYSKNKNIIKRMLIFLYNKLNSFIESYFDGYIFLTIYMNDLINKRKKEYLIIEGFVSEVELDIFQEKQEKQEKRIAMYAGTLHEKFGIKKLIEAFKKIDIKNSELWILGEGDSLDYIQEMANLDSRIKYKGTKTKDQILKMEKQVSLLINPRPSSEEFTKYSFPSKTLEYMASGTPLLTTKLLGIPDEYFKYVYFFENEDIDEMSKTIENIMKKPKEELEIMGERAQNFIKKNKMIDCQIKKIEFYLNNLIEKK